jgi:hypothetical protein
MGGKLGGAQKSKSERCSCLDRVDLECGYMSTVQRLHTEHQIRNFWPDHARRQQNSFLESHFSLKTDDTQEKRDTQIPDVVDSIESEE